MPPVEPGSALVSDPSTLQNGSEIPGDSQGGGSVEEQLDVVSDESYGGASYEAGVVLVDLVEWTTPEEAVTAFEQETGFEGFAIGGDAGDYSVVRLPAGMTVTDAIEVLESSKVVGAVQPNFVYSLQAEDSNIDLAAGTLASSALQTQADTLQVNDSLASYQWALDAMNLPEAWAIAMGAGAISDDPAEKKRTVAVIDEGFASEHADLNGVVVDTYNSYNASKGTTASSSLKDISPIQSDSHGTHVAGIVGARANNGIGIAGVSYNARLQLIKAGTGSGSSASFTTASLAAGIKRAADTASTYGTRVASMSLGGGIGPVSEFDYAMTSAIDTAYTKGVAVVCSSGNNTSSTPVPYVNYPSDYPTAVSAINAQQETSSSGGSYTRAPGSNYNMSSSDWGKDVSAPGTSIYSLSRYGGYITKNGTSMAAPQVAGVLSLIFAVDPGLSADEAVNILYSTTIDLNKSKNRTGTTFDNETGFGFVDAEAAVSAAARKMSVKGVGTVQKGKTTALSATAALGSNCTWSSSDSSVATVDKSGVVRGVNAGVAVISAKGVDGESMSRVVTVYDPQVSGASLMTVGGSASSSLSSSVAGTWAWTSSNANAIQVDSTSGKITAKGAGTSTITATLLTNPAISASYTITAYTAALTGASSVNVASTTRLYVTSSLSGSWRWTSSDTSVATVDSNGIVAGKKAGTVTITATSTAQNSIRLTKAVTVVKPSASANRIYGNEALDTMQRIVSVGGWQAGGTVVLVTDGGYWDGLTANGVAGLAGAPIVMTNSNSLSWQARQTIASLRPKKIIVIGGTYAISQGVVNAARAAAGTSPDYVRLWGQAADDTAYKIYQQGSSAAGGTWSSTAFVCTDSGYWDALSAAPISYVKHMPIFLTHNGGASLSNETLSVMKAGGIKYVYIVGGRLAVNPYVQTQIERYGMKVIDRIWGETAIDTSDKVARFAVQQGLSANSMGVATSGGYWDALAGAALCGKNGSALIIVDGPGATTISGFARSYKSSIVRFNIFGGPYAISNATETSLKNTLK